MQPALVPITVMQRFSKYAALALFSTTLCLASLAAPVVDPSPFPPFATPPVESATQRLPKLIQRVEAIYPAELLSSKKQDVVYIAFVVETNGSVSQVRAFFSRYPEFEKPAIEAVQQWKFTPGMDAGHIVRTRMTVPIHFEPEPAK